MKKLTALFLALALCLSLCSVTAFATPAEESDFTFDSSTGKITGYKGAGGAVEIPATIGGVAVTSIDDWAFSLNNLLTSVTIPTSVTTIGEYAFFQCESLASVTIPASVTTIGNGAFQGTQLTTVTIPANVTTIDDNTFKETKLTTVTIPANVVTIGQMAFYDCKELTSVTVVATTPSEVGLNAFTSCNPALKIYVPAGSVEAYKTNWNNYADWIEAIPTYYTVTFDANGHGTAPASYTNVASGTTVNKPDDPTAAGYTFGGWYKEAGCTNAWNFATDTVTANTTLYAKWTKTGGGNHHDGGNPAVTSASTADAGIALYGVLSVSSLLGMGWVSKKKR